ncbi:tyrosine-type recombinase/integrase [Micromonospora palomenae]|uniref:tyrosine-type recombinase/integrase n=1 Tax=Micromonospora palomenae TaxID=1461247 RepID=UPI001FE34D2F|nr:tyrosine-type recombinase/integrase [Micromonospora palomenae]
MIRSRPIFRTRVFAPAAASVGLAGLTPHDLRHTAASLAVAAGANVKAVQRMLGHASASMTLDVYAGLFGDDLDAVANRLDEAIAARDKDYLKDSARQPGRDRPGETAKPRSLTWASVPSRLTESNRRPTHYESVPWCWSTIWFSCLTWCLGPGSSADARQLGCSDGCSSAIALLQRGVRVRERQRQLRWGDLLYGEAPPRLVEARTPQRWCGSLQASPVPPAPAVLCQ